MTEQGNKNGRNKNGRNKNEKNKKNTIFASILVATTAIGPGFLTQTAVFTQEHRASFGFAILVSLILAAVAQLNIWRVLCHTGLRGQELANRLLPGLGYGIALLIVAGGLIFNIGNVGGGAMGWNTLLGLPMKWGTLLTGAFAIGIFLIRNAQRAMDYVTTVLSAGIILVVVILILLVHPPIGEAARCTLVPEEPVDSLFPAVLTLLGGTIGGYITFSGAHRLIADGVTGAEHQPEVTRSALSGIGIAAGLRFLLFLAILGVVNLGAVLGSENPIVDVFAAGAGPLGTYFAGIVLVCASAVPVLGAAYTSVSFFKTFHPALERREKELTIAMIALSTLCMFLLGRPAALLILAGAVNGLILPVTLFVCLIAARCRKIVGKEYRHPAWLWIAGFLVALLSAVMGAASIGELL
ncbi:MAG: divalent metal cation transporter [Lachnospiraceae bacterium]|nr:divalent metal cation transporter [Lachnospiraceae bacterium]